MAEQKVYLLFATIAIVYTAMSHVLSNSGTDNGHFLNPTAKLRTFLTKASITYNIIPNKYRMLISIVRYKVQCESRKVGRIISSTVEGERNCSEVCRRKVWLLSSNLNQLLTNVLIKMNKLLMAEQPDNQIIVKFVPKHNTTVNSECTPDKHWKKVQCRCSFKLQLYGSDSSKMIIERVIERYSTTRCSKKQESDAPPINDSDTLNVDLLQNELYKLNELQDEQANSNSKEHPTSVEVNSRSSSGDAVFADNESHGLVRRSFYPKNKFMNYALRLLHLVILTAIVLILIYVACFPLSWIILPLIGLLILVAK